MRSKNIADRAVGHNGSAGIARARQSPLQHFEAWQQPNYDLVNSNIHIFLQHGFEIFIFGQRLVQARHIAVRAAWADTPGMAHFARTAL